MCIPLLLYTGIQHWYSVLCYRQTQHWHNSLSDIKERGFYHSQHVHYIYEADFSKTHNEKPRKLPSTHKAFFLLGTKIAMNLE